MAFHKTEKEFTIIKSSAKFNSKCVECGDKIYEGDEYYYDYQARKAYCAVCGLELIS